jgi:hypothetical protein
VYVNSFYSSLLLWEKVYQIFTSPVRLNRD